MGVGPPRRRRGYRPTPSHAGMVVVADGSDRADRCLGRVLFNDPALGIFRHADAGYAEAEETGQRRGILLPADREE
jgi:urocanate hydratase